MCVVPKKVYTAAHSPLSVVMLQFSFYSRSLVCKMLLCAHLIWVDEEEREGEGELEKKTNFYEFEFLNEKQLKINIYSTPDFYLPSLVLPLAILFICHKLYGKD